MRLEKLSNWFCSLRPNEDKLSYSCFMEIAPNGRLVNHPIEETVINSNQRFSYEQAQDIIDGAPSDYSVEMKSAAKLAHILVDNRFREGSVNCDTPEPEFALDEDG